MFCRKGAISQFPLLKFPTFNFTFQEQQQLLMFMEFFVVGHALYA